jgi:hypothetical protein
MTEARIEVTPEMVAAGEREISIASLDLNPSPLNWLPEVYRAMRRIEPALKSRVLRKMNEGKHKT